MTTTTEHPWDGLPVLKGEEQQLYVKLDQDELLAKGELLTREMAALILMEDRHKTERKEMKAAEAEQKVRISDIRTIRAEGREKRSVPVDHLVDLHRGVIYEVRRDTGTMVRRRPMSEAERELQQTRLLSDRPRAVASDGAASKASLRLAARGDVTHRGDPEGED